MLLGLHILFHKAAFGKHDTMGQDKSKTSCPMFGSTWTIHLTVFSPVEMDKLELIFVPPSPWAKVVQTGLTQLFFFFHFTVIFFHKSENTLSADK